MSSIFEALKTSQQAMINKATNDALHGVINNSIPRDGRNLLNDSRVKFINNGAEQLLSSVGITIGGVIPLYQNVIKPAYDSAKRIVEAKLDNVLNDKTLPLLGDYQNNEALKYNDSPIGFLASEINNISDAQAVLLLGNAPSSLYDPPNDDTIIDNKTDTTIPPNGNNPLNSNGNNGGNNQPPIKDYGTLSSEESYSQVLNGYVPKAKFLFIVHFEFNDKELKDDFTFLIHKFDRPSITINYEDVNFYNFKTNIPKSINYDPVSFDIHDDQSNYSLNFIVSYLRRISPLFNQRDGSNLEINGLNFENSSSSYGLHYKGLDETSGRINIIKNVTVYHLYNHCNSMDVHIFNNPKIENISLNELNMAEGSVGSSATIKLIYDNYYLDTGLAAKIPDNVLSISELQALSPLDVSSISSVYDKKYANLLTLLEDKNPESSKDADTNDADHNVPLYDENGEMVDEYTPSESLKSDIENGLNPKVSMSDDQLNKAANNAIKPNVVNDLNTMNNDPIDNPLSSDIVDNVTPNFPSSALKE